MTKYRTNMEECGSMNTMEGSQRAATHGLSPVLPPPSTFSSYPMRTHAPRTHTSRESAHPKEDNHVLTSSFTPLLLPAELGPLRTNHGLDSSHAARIADSYDSSGVREGCEGSCEGACILWSEHYGKRGERGVPHPDYVHSEPVFPNFFECHEYTYVLFPWFLGRLGTVSSST